MRLKSAGELSGVLNTVLFCPEDLSLIRDGAAARRRFLDECICQLRPRYAMALAEYKKLYEHKIRILRDWTEKPSLLDALDEFFPPYGSDRSGAHPLPGPLYTAAPRGGPPIHSDFSGGRERLDLRYETVKTVTDPEAPMRDILSQLLEHQESHRQAELESRQCLSGPHKDDLAVDLDGVSAKTYASQGQTRTAALSLKLGCREIFFMIPGMACPSAGRRA